jgi:SPP1 family predicted phage head-tail adaptor
MNPGELRNRLMIQSRVVTRNTYGEEVASFLTQGTIWGKVSPLNAREYFMNQQAQSQVTHQVTIRYFSGLRTDWRILWGTRVFDIRSIINPDERNEEQILLCTEFVT